MAASPLRVSFAGLAALAAIPAGKPWGQELRP